MLGWWIKGGYGVTRRKLIKKRENKRKTEKKGVNR